MSEPDGRAVVKQESKWVEKHSLCQALLEMLKAYPQAPCSDTAMLREGVSSLRCGQGRKLRPLATGSAWSSTASGWGLPTLRASPAPRMGLTRKMQSRSNHLQRHSGQQTDRVAAGSNTQAVQPGLGPQTDLSAGPSAVLLRVAF